MLKWFPCPLSACLLILTRTVMDFRFHNIIREYVDQMSGYQLLLQKVIWFVHPILLHSVSVCFPSWPGMLHLLQMLAWFEYD
jgi:hypothetical protein